ncbi:YitT family protein [Alicyclobacillus dauci]|uniref:YitT family protein n=1 Tax=Alicyclobacillus dauci TaxID=1475485 RepID=A0ABY6YX30_9BACL|nr:YitT family protein [Alicyclobacillus dauci]WAH35134.1 YitT family protein [Alicyclobacillus dauci]
MLYRSPVQWLMILAGSLIYSIGLNGFLITNHLAEGGFVGISVLLLYLFHLPVGATFFILNIPLLFIAWRMFGRQFVLNTGVGVIGVSVFSELTKFIHIPTEDRLLAALYAGVVTGIGLGLIFRTGGTTGGADIIARILRHYRGVGMGRTLFSIDLIVILMVIVVIGKQVAMYSLVALFVSSRVIDFVIEGAQSGKALTIISENHSAIVAAIHEQLERGTTLLQAMGGYTGQSRQVVYCVVAREEVVRVQRIVHEVDPKAFVTVSNVHEVLGEGFTYDVTVNSPLKRRFLKNKN